MENIESIMGANNVPVTSTLSQPPLSLLQHSSSSPTNKRHCKPLASLPKRKKSENTFVWEVKDSNIFVYIDENKEIFIQTLLNFVMINGPSTIKIAMLVEYINNTKNQAIKETFSTDDMTLNENTVDDVVMHGFIQILDNLKRFERDIHWLFPTNYTKICFHACSLVKLNSIEPKFNNDCFKEKLQQQQQEQQPQLNNIYKQIEPISNINMINHHGWVHLPSWIANKKACINIQNTDKYCFKWALISCFSLLKKNLYKPSEHKIKDISADVIKLANGLSLDFSGLEFPLAIDHIRRFEQKNPDMSFMVYMISNNGDESITEPCYRSAERKRLHTNLLAAENHHAQSYHYVWIKNLLSLLKKQITGYNGKTYLCEWCLFHTHRERIMVGHHCNEVIMKPVRKRAINHQRINKN